MKQLLHWFFLQDLSKMKKRGPQRKNTLRNPVQEEGLWLDFIYHCLILPRSPKMLRRDRNVSEGWKTKNKHWLFFSGKKQSKKKIDYFVSFFGLKTQKRIQCHLKTMSNSRHGICIQKIEFYKYYVKIPDLFTDHMYLIIQKTLLSCCLFICKFDCNCKYL